MIPQKRLGKVFSVHLVHKHFDIPDGRVIVYETARGPNHPDFVLSSPRMPERCENLRGLCFQATPDNKMVTYEFTTDPGNDITRHEAFVAEFNAAVMDLGVRNVFALTAKPTDARVLTEFEMPDLASTVLAYEPNWLLSEGQKSTSTDWVANEASAGGVPGVIQLMCTVTCHKRRHKENLTT
ncbi:MAG: hypothetical protein M1832_005265 [Thelocarpon impressellum]|nr:MAG: hypothetical protein M1832_005265 [Thelocarpon impressellum]